MFAWLSVVSTHTSISALNQPVAVEHRVNTVETGLRSLSETCNKKFSLLMACGLEGNIARYVRLSYFIYYIKIVFKSIFKVI